ncbi:universal stress protein [Streptomyces fradiae]|uniref:universal stress protein n=1 Tax=Streptomyces fradiae TaxID=1906 RepID=UPI002943A4EC|nr:universal stress protein [Streptomyces fradiae]WOI61283.1 universal stress protein [Streptomyces fradiae]
MAQYGGGGTVVAGVAEDEHQDEIVHFAAEEAARRGLRLRILHAVEWPLPPGSRRGGKPTSFAERAEEVVAPLQEAVSRDFPEVDVSPDLVSGSPVPALVGRSSWASLIVVGHRGAGGFARLPLGSVSRQVAARARCPVVVVGPGDTGRFEDHRVVVGVDLPDVRSDVMHFAIQAAGTRRAVLEAVYAAFQPPVLKTGPAGPAVPEPSAVADDARALLDQALRPHRLENPGIEIRSRVEGGRPAAVLTRAAGRAELLVVGSHGRTGLKRLVLGSVSAQVLHSAGCPVAVLPTGGT